MFHVPSNSGTFLLAHAPHFKLIVKRGASEFWSPSKLSWQTHRFACRRYELLQPSWTLQDRKYKGLAALTLETSNAHRALKFPVPADALSAQTNLLLLPVKCADSLLLSFHANSVSKWQEPLLKHTLQWANSRSPFKHCNTWKGLWALCWMSSGIPFFSQFTLSYLWLIFCKRANK